MLLKNFYLYKIILDDGTIIHESAPDEPAAFRFEGRNPDFNRIAEFRLIPKDEVHKPIQITVPKGGRLIYFRRTVANSANEFPRFHIYLLGVQRTNKGRNEKEVIFIFPDGTTEMCFGDEPAYQKVFIQKLKAGL